VPLFRSSKGEENVGNIADSYDVRTGKRIETPTTEPPAGCTPTVNPCGSAVCGTAQNGTCGNVNCGTCGSGYDCIGGTCVLQLTVGCEATGGSKCWYVDNLATGMNNGSNWANAWGNLSNINWASVRPGDFVYISGGAINKTYTNSFTITVSGNITSPITFRPGIDSGHNGIVIFDYDYLGDSATINGINFQNRNYLTFNGTINGEKHWQIKNLRNILDRTPGCGLYAYQTNRITVDGLTFRNINNPINIFYSTNTTIMNSNLFETRGNAGISLSSSFGVWDSNKIYNNYIELLFNSNEPPGATYTYDGPDGISCRNATSIYNNTFKEIVTTVYTSDQHPDMLQITGNYIKIYNNEFINVGDSVIDYDTYANPNPSNILIYNNIFRINESIDLYPEYFRMYTNHNNISSITNLKIFNNLFVDNSDLYLPLRFTFGTANPTASGVEFRNNIFYNIGISSGRPVITIPNSTNFNSDSFAFSNNVYYTPSGTSYVNFRGVIYTVTNWITQYETNSKTTAPLFTRYTPYALDNDFHLTSSDTSARDSGISLASSFVEDKEKISRPQGSAWDIGPYEYH